MEATLTHLLEMCKDQVGRLFFFFTPTKDVFRLIELFASDTIYTMVSNRPSSWFFLLAYSSDTHSVVSVIEPYRMMCYVRDLKTVRDCLKSLDDTKLRNAYCNHRMDVVKEVRTVC